MQERYLIIPEWMLDLGLNTAERDAYALVWGFCQDGESDYHGSASYVARWCGVRREAAVRILRKLTDMGLLRKTEEPGHPSHYTTQGCAIIEGVRKSHTGCAEIAQPTCTEIAHDNKVVNNKADNKDIPVVLPRTRERLTFGEYVQLTEEEHAKLVRRFGAEDTARLIEILDGYLSNPKQRNRYADHYRALLGWPVQRLQEEKLTAQRLHNSKEAGQRVASGGNTAPVGYGEQAMANARRLEELLKG